MGLIEAMLKIDRKIESLPFWHVDIIYGVLQSKANSRHVIKTKNITYTKTGKMRPAGSIMSVKSAEAQRFVNSFLWQCKKIPAPYSGPVSLTAIIHYPDNRHDLDESLLMDCIEKAGIIKNDRQIIKKHIERGKVNPNNPMVCFALKGL